ncbi:Protein OS-9-like protein [Yarrowia sp. B02]|nr:Protein OS-9-like protein [Yarrowia sp. B02]
MLFKSLALVASSSLAAAFNIGDDLFADPQFTVQFHNRPLRRSDVQGGLLPSHDPVYGHPLGYEMMQFNGTNHICGIPEVTTTKSSKKEQEGELSPAEARERALELMLPLLGDCLFYEQGFFSYRFCYGSGVVQYRRHGDNYFPRIYPPPQAEDSPTFVLGSFEKDDTTNTVTSAGGIPFLAHRLRSGTHCTLTGANREIEVQFVCDKTVQHDQILWIKEKRTCNYVMQVGTPRLCRDMRFQPPPDESLPIMCYSVESEANEFETIDGMFDGVAQVKEEQEAGSARAHNYVGASIDKIDEIEVAWRFTKARALNYIGVWLGDFVNRQTLFKELGIATPSHEAPFIIQTRSMLVPAPINRHFEVRLMISRQQLLISINDDDVTLEEKYAWWQEQGDMSNLEIQGLPMLDDAGIEDVLARATDEIIKQINKETKQSKRLAKKKEEMATKRKEVAPGAEEDDGTDTVTSTQTVYQTQTRSTAEAAKEETQEQEPAEEEDEDIIVTMYFENGEFKIEGFEAADFEGVKSAMQELAEHDEDEDDYEDYGLSD